MVLRRKLALALILFLFLCLLASAACAPPPTAPPLTSPPPTATAEPETSPTTPTEPTPRPTPAGPKTLVVCQGEEPRTLFWLGTPDRAARHIQEAIYDGPIDHRGYDYQPIILEKLPSLPDGDAIVDTVIVQEGDEIVDANNNPVELTEGVILRPTGCHSPECAIEFTGEPVEMDQMEVTFTLLEGIRWSDGEPVTADDSVYGFEMHSHPDTPAAKYTTLRTASYEALDEQSTLWMGLPGYLDHNYALNFFHPLPRHLWEEELGYTAGDLVTAEESTRRPLGWGPFTIKEWIAGDHITVVRNPLYFRSDEDLPKLDAVIYRFVADPNVALTQLLAGECDIVTQDGGLDSQTDLLIELDEHGVLHAEFATDTLWEHLDFGINTARSYNRPDFFGDVRMRRAVAYCLDRVGAVEQLLYGRSQVLDSYLPPGHPLFDAELVRRYRHDPDAGMTLLEELGWTDEDGDGIREAHGVEGIRENTPLEFTWQSTNQDLHVRYMEIFQEDLAECGIQVFPQSLPSLEFFAQGPEGPLYGRAFDVASFAWSSSVTPPPCDLYLTSEIPDEDNDWSSSNFSGFSNETYDVICTAALQALPGMESYVQRHLEAQRIFSEQLPALPLFLRLKTAATRINVLGFEMDATETSEMWNIEAFDLER